MTDEQSWQAPGGPPIAPSGPPAPSAPAPFSGYSPPPGAPDAGQPAGWTPPPKPGLIPLRPLDLGTILGASFRVLRRNPRPTFGVALLVQGVVTLVTLGVVGYSTISSLVRIDNAGQADENTIIAGTVGVAFVSALLSVFLGLVANAWLQGIIVIEVSRAALGEKLTLKQLWGLAKGRFGALIGWSLLIAGVFLVAIAIVVAVIWLMVSTMGALGVGLGVLVGFLGGIALLVVGVWVGTKLSLVPSALMIERVRLREAIARSWSLTNQAFWKTFGIQLLVSVIVGIAMNVIVAPFSILAPLLLILLDPNGTGSATAVIAAVVVYILQLVVTLVLSAIGAIIQTAATALIYIDLRMRKEGLDLELAKYVEGRQATTTSLGNPYLRPESTPSGYAPTINSPWA